MPEAKQDSESRVWAVPPDLWPACSWDFGSQRCLVNAEQINESLYITQWGTLRGVTLSWVMADLWQLRFCTKQQMASSSRAGRRVPSRGCAGSENPASLHLWARVKRVWSAVLKSRAHPPEARLPGFWCGHFYVQPGCPWGSHLTTSSPSCLLCNLGWCQCQSHEALGEIKWSLRAERWE